jgi:DNA-binding beta-propeller fold protein YncE
MKLMATLAAVAVLAGCAASPNVMSYFPENPGNAVLKAWPDVDRVPRLEYAGQLIGEHNFVAENAAEGRGKRFLRWIVGLANGSHDPKRLIRPQSGVVDATGRILVTDTGRQGIFVFDESRGTFDIWYAAAPDLDFSSPVGIAERSAGGFIVADAELAEVFILAADGRPIGRFGAGELVRPTGVGIDKATGDIFVADTGAHRIKVFTAGGKLARTIGVPGDAPGELNAPMHINVSGGKVYVSDTLNARVQIFSVSDGELVGLIGRRGLFVGNLVRPKGVAVDSDGNVYVVESYHDHLLVYDDEGEFLLPVGGTGSGVGQFFLPAGAWSDEHDRIFISDMFNGRVIILRYVGA